MPRPTGKTRISLADLEPRRDGYVPIRSYAPIGDTRSVALVAHDGSIDWYPVPELDALPVFARIVDAPRGGYLKLQPLDAFTVERAYLAGTNVLTTTFTTETGSVRITDAMSMGMTGPLPWNELLRHVEGLSGEVALRWSVRPGSGLGVGSPWLTILNGQTLLQLKDVVIGVITDGVTHTSRHRDWVAGEIHTTAGSHHLVATVATEHEPLHLPSVETLYANLELTKSYWQRWSQRFHYSGSWSDEVRRSALVLRLLTNVQTGAIAAAATTSLPEAWSGDKNWDYRFAWVRDAAYTLHALLAFGEEEEAHGAVSWLLSMLRRQQDDILMFTTLAGDVPPGEQQMDAAGWRGIGPVVTGNRAAHQRQLSVYGDIFKLMHYYVGGGHVLDTATQRLLEGIANRVCDEWRRQDHGKWELLEQRHYTSSKMGCWVALDAAISLAEQQQMRGDTERWKHEREQIRQWIETNCWSDRLASYTWHDESEELDASVLLYAMYGFDVGERMSSTIDAVLEHLSEGPLVYRFSGARNEEGAFVTCTFWAVAALACVGRQEEARTLMSEAVPLANDVGVFSEMIDPEQLEFLGNIPQGLSHLALMEAALRLLDTAGPSS